MTLKTNPIFYYGFEVPKDYNWIDFKEGVAGPELSVKVQSGSYTLEELRSLIENAFNSTGTLNYTVQADRYTRILTILSDSPFTLLNETGSHALSSLLVYVGFGSTPIWGAGGLYGSSSLTYGATDSESYFLQRASFPVGFAYEPQFCPQDYLDADDNCQLREAQVNESVSGEEVEVISFGEDSFYEMNFRYITNLKMPKDGPIKNNPQAKEEINAFLKWAKTRKVIEFIPDLRNPNKFEKIRFEKGAGGKSGTGYRLKELVPKLPDFFETGKTTFRRL